MATQVYRVARVLAPVSSPVARLEALDDESHELRLEVPAALVQRIAPGHVLVVNWSVHALPEPVTPAAAEHEAAGTPEVAPAEAGGRSVDEAFMALMSRVRRGTAVPLEPTTSSTPPVTQTRDVSDIEDEFKNLLGPAQAKGSTNGR